MEPRPHPLLHGHATTAPAAPGDPLFVHIPSWGGQPFGPLPWTPHGNSYPRVGDECLVAVDERGEKWVIAWKGPWT